MSALNAAPVIHRLPPTVSLQALLQPLLDEVRKMNTKLAENQNDTKIEINAKLDHIVALILELSERIEAVEKQTTKKKLIIPHVKDN